MYASAAVAAAILPATVGAILASSSLSSRSSNVTNNTIVYSDTVLNLKEIGSNIKIQSISNVGECSFESCVETIFNSNPNVTFNTVQYSRVDEKVYFYTDSTISTKAWDDRNVKRSTYSKVNIEVLEDLKKLFAEKQECPRDAVSVNDVMSVLRQRYSQVERTKKNLMDRIKSKLRTKYCSSASCSHPRFSKDEFNYENEEMGLTFRPYFYTYVNAKFKKENGDLYESECNNIAYKNDFLPLIGKELSELFDSYFTFEDFYSQSAKIAPLNSGFEVSVNKSYIEILIPSVFLSKEFSLILYNFSSDFKIKSNSLNIVELLKGNARELFRRIFVKIDDCPQWMKPILYNQKQEQIQKEQRQIELQQQRKQAELERQAKKDQRMALVRKIISFGKK